MKLTAVKDGEKHVIRPVINVKGPSMFKYVLLVVGLYILFRGEPDLLDAIVGWITKC